MYRVWVAAFRPADPEYGGVGGFDWYHTRDAAVTVFVENVKNDPDRESEHALWSHVTDLDPVRDAVLLTTEIDDLEWGWFPDNRRHTALVWS